MKEKVENEKKRMKKKIEKVVNEKVENELKRIKKRRKKF